MISVIDTIDTKKKMLEVCIDDLQTFTQGVKARMKEFLKKGRRVKEAAEDIEASLTSKVENAEISALEYDLDHAVKEMRILKYLLKTHQEEHDKVGLGAVVVTHRNSFFVSADLQRFEMDGQSFIAISNQCPLFKSMRGKKRGERFVHKDLSYQILDIY
jgi:hypothetical protein